MKTLFAGADIITCDQSGTILKNASLVIEGSKITYVGNLRQEGRFDRVIECPGSILMPGLVNAHTHSPMSLLRGLRDDCALETWLREIIWPAENRLTSDDIHWGTLLSVAEMIAYGTVSFSDMYRHSSILAETISKTGIKATICESITSPSGTAPLDLEQVRESINMIEKWDGYADGLIHCDTSIQSIFQTTPKLWDFIAQFASDKQIGVHSHLSETEKEQQNCIQEYGNTPVGILKQHGVFNNRVVAIHGTFLTAEDIEILVSSNASVVHDPASNLKTCCITARLKPWLDAGLNVALGTDGVCSNNSADLFETMKQTALLQKSFENDTGWMSAAQVLKMAIAGGWISQGRFDESGVLQPGYDADLILLDANHPGMLPNHQPMSSVVYSAHGNHVKLTMVRGRILYENGEYNTIDMEQLRYYIRRFHAQTQ